jgi:hypothetical protein
MEEGGGKVRGEKWLVVSGQWPVVGGRWSVVGGGSVFEIEM